jgi:hypothetical protein
MKTIYWNQAKIGDSALVNAENKMGVILKQYGQSFYLTFVDGSSKTYDASELTFYSSDDDYDQYDKGGNVETGSAHIYINFQNSNIDVYHGDDYWLLAKAEPMLVIENAKPESWNELWESIRSIVSDDSNLGANKKNMGAAHVYISKSNGNIYVYHGDDVTEGKKPKLLFSKQNVKKDSWSKIWITLTNLESVKMKNGGSIKEATNEQWKSILTKLLNQFYGDYEDSTPEDYENNDLITVDEAKPYYENFMDRYKTEKSMSQAYSDFYKSLTDEEKKLIEVKTASEQYADAEEHDRNKSYRTITIRKKQNMEKMKIGGSVKSLKRGDKLTILGDDYEFLRIDNDKSQGYKQEVVFLYDVKRKEMKSFPLDMVEAYSKYKTGGVIGQNIVIDYQGDEKRGYIKEITDDGDYIVNTDDGRTVLAQKELDIISFGGTHKFAPQAKKRFGFFKDGGSIEQENNQMLHSQSVEAKHHADELSRILTSKTRVEPWVVAKMERATTDLSDVTHYLEGEDKAEMKKPIYAHGGGVGDVSFSSRQVEKANLEQLFDMANELEMSNYQNLNKEILRKRILEHFKLTRFKGRMAHGGMAEHGLKRGDTIVYNQADDVMVIDKKNNQHLINLDKGERYNKGGAIEKYNIKNRTKYWIYDGDNLEMAGTVSILPNNYIQIKDPKGFVYSLSLLENKYKNLKFKIYEKFAMGGSVENGDTIYVVISCNGCSGGSAVANPSCTGIIVDDGCTGSSSATLTSTNYTVVSGDIGNTLSLDCFATCAGACL